MDQVGIRELVKSGVRLAHREWKESVPSEGQVGGITPPGLLNVADRLTQLGMIALDYDEPDVWTEGLRGLLDLYALGVRGRKSGDYRLPTRETWLLVDIVQRVIMLGAVGTKLQRFQQVRELILQRPLQERPETFWIRHCVTMASRGEIHEAFKGKSLIGPASERVREQPQFLALFDENLDHAVDMMCQFDFLQCVVARAETKDDWSYYPNFGGYFEHRTQPIVHDLIRQGPSRAVVPGLSNPELSLILKEINSITTKHFFEIAGWGGYDAETQRFIAQNEQR